MCVGGGPAGDAWGSARRPGKGPERAAGPSGPRAALVFRVSLSTKWAADAGARLHLDFLCDSGAGHEGCSEETARHIWVTGGCLAFPSLSPATSAQKICPRAAVCCPLRGNHLRIGTRVLILLCRHGCVPPHRAGAAFPKGAWPAKKGCPLQDLGAFPRLILSLPVARTWGRVIGSIRSEPKPEAFSKMQQGPNQAAANRRTYRSRASELL